MGLGLEISAFIGDVRLTPHAWLGHNENEKNACFDSGMSFGDPLKEVFSTKLESGGRPKLKEMIAELSGLYTPYVAGWTDNVARSGGR